MLTRRQMQGFIVEAELNHSLEGLGLVRNDTLFSNPSNPDEWVRTLGYGADARIVIGTLLISAEVKSNSAPIYESYVNRDYIPRFLEGLDEGLRFIVTDNVFWYTPRIVKTLRRRNITVISKDAFIAFVKRMIALAKAKRVTSSMSSISSIDSVGGVGSVDGVICGGLNHVFGAGVVRLGERWGYTLDGGGFDACQSVHRCQNVYGGDRGIRGIGFLRIKPYDCKRLNAEAVSGN